MSCRYAEWLRYAILDENGSVCGISDDAPDEIKEQYYEMKRREQEIIDRGGFIPL